MVKKGPCFHCNINSTPIWRNGPAEKPVLCNACGSQFRLWGNLRNYYPKHSQNHSLSNLKNMFSERANLKSKGKAPAGTSKIITSGISPSLWNASSIPSKKRSKVVYKRLTPIEMFQKQLIRWWKYDTKPNEPAPEEVLLMHSAMNNFVPSNEIGLGGMLLKPPNVTSTMKY